ncbi:MAG: DUF4892 domain-containing protein [Neptuniibacter sp.]
MFKRFSLLLALCVPLSAFAADDISNSRDYKKFERFPSSYIVQYKQSQTRDYRLILGGLEKIDGSLRAEKEKRIAGQLTQITYRIPENHSAKEAFEYFYAQIIDQGGEKLFRCSGRDCGSSNQWANNIFSYFRLYGVDNTQSFSSLQLEDSYISLYSVKRGNKRVYLRLDILESSASKAESQQTEAGQISREITSDNDFDELVKFFKQKPDSVLWVVAYDFNSGTKQQQIKRSEERAKQFKDKLVAAGADSSQVYLHAAGSFILGKQTERGTKLMVYSENRVE